MVRSDLIAFCRCG